jgi:hypothetical protein
MKSGKGEKVRQVTSAITRAWRTVQSSMNTYYLDTVLKQHSFKNICIGQVLKTAVRVATNHKKAVTPQPKTRNSPSTLSEKVGAAGEQATDA